MNDQPAKLTNPFVAILKSLYSESLYREVYVSWKKRAFLFLIALLVIFWIPFIARFMINLNEVVHAFSANIIKEFPALQIKDGIATSEKKGVHFVYYPNTRLPILVVDTTDSYKKFKTDAAAALIAKTGVYFKDGTGKLKEILYPKDMNLKVTGDFIVDLYNEHKPKVALFFASILYLGGFSVIYMIYLIFSILLSFLMTAMFNGVDRSISFGRSLSLSVVAAAPSFILFSLLYAFGILSYGWAIVLLFIIFGYTFYAIYCCFLEAPKRIRRK